MDERLLDLLMQWEEASSQGGSADLAKLANGDEKLLAQLQRHIASLQKLAWLEAPETSAVELKMPTVQSLHSSLLMPDDIDLKAFRSHLSAADIIPPAKLKELIDSNNVRTGPQLAGLLLQNELVTRFQLRSIAHGKTRGLKLGRYVILDKIGEGGMGQVYKARHSKMGRIVALKVLPRAAMSKSQGIERFNQEMKVAAKLRHENIVTAYDADEADGIHFFVMEHVEGRDLSSLVRRQGPLSVATAVDCLIQAAQGLEYAHGVGLVHRDIKPANLLMDSTGVVKILDMGIARIQSDSDQTGLTQNGAVMGTVDFMAPEQAVNAKGATASADLYSLGCSLYYLLTGRPPFAGETLMVKLLGHRERPAPSLLNARRDVPPALQAIYEKCMAKSPADRFKNASELISALRRIRPHLSDAPPALSLSSMDTASDSSATSFFETQPFSSSSADVGSVPTIDSHAPRSRPRVAERGVAFYGGAIGALLLLFTFVYFAAGFLFPASPDPGSLVVEVDVDDLTAHLRDQEVTIVNQATKARTPIRLLSTEQLAALAPGEYQFDLDPNGPVQTDVGQLTIQSGVESRVRVTWNNTAASPASSVSETAADGAPAMAIAPFDESQAQRHQAEWASYLGIPELSANNVGMTFRMIPPGEFVMGSPTDQIPRLNDEIEHQVRISRPYLMADTEVTRGQWEAVMGPRAWDIINSSKVPNSSDLPASPITWEEATEFCRRLSEKEGKTYRLPTEAEWEFACRAGSETAYSFGDDAAKLVDYAWHSANALTANEPFAHPIRQKRPNPFQLYDMPGNVWEWCSDWYGANYAVTAPRVDPPGPSRGPYHVQRGGSWHYASDVCRSASRSVTKPERPEYIGGFRVVQPFTNVPPQTPPKRLSPAGAYALKFDGLNDYVELPFGYKGEYPLTLEIVLQVPRYAPGLHNFLGTSENSGVRLEFIGNPQNQKMPVQMGLAHPSGAYQMVSSLDLPPPGTTTNLTATIDSRQYCLFVDGKKVAEGAMAASGRLFNDLRWIVGASPNLNRDEPLPIDFPFRGVIQQLRISNAVLYQDDFQPQYQFDSGPQTMALYQFREGEGTRLTDSSGHNRHGVIHGDPDWIPLTNEDIAPTAPLPFALEFDGVDDYVELPYPFNLPAPWTLEMVAVTPTNPNDRSGALFSTTESRGLGWTINKTKTEGVFDSEFLIHSSRRGAYIGLTAKDIAPPDAPVNFTVVSTPQTVTYYVAGKRIGEIKIPEAERNYGDLKALLGASPSLKPYLRVPIDFPFRGKIQQFRISTTDRYRSEFTPRYQFDADDNTYALYRFDEGSGTTLHDSSGNHRDGVIHGNPRWVNDRSNQSPTQSSSAPVAGDAATAPRTDVANGVSIDLLTLLQFPDDVVQGEWVRSGDAITSQSNQVDSLYVPYAITGNYKIGLEFTRTAGDDALKVRLPTMQSYGEFQIGGGKSAAASAPQIGLTNSPNLASAAPLIPKNGRRYRLEATVRFKPTGNRPPLPNDLEFVGTLDGQPILILDGAGGTLACDSKSFLPEVRMMGLTSYNSTYSIHKFEIQPLDDGVGRVVQGSDWSNDFYPVDDAPPPAMERICKQWNGRYYLFLQGKMPLPAAQHIAHVHRARLVTISSPEEEAFLVANMPGKTFWTSAWRPEGGATWRDQRNRPLPYIGKWEANEPDLKDSQKLAAVVIAPDATSSQPAVWRQASPADMSLYPVFEWGEEEVNVDRRAAEYALSIGGKVRINDDSQLGTTRLIDYRKLLPAEPFRLTHVEIRNNRTLTDAGLAAFRGTTHLRRLSLLYSSQVTPAAIANFAENRDVMFLELWGCQLNAEALPHLEKMHSIVDFRFGYNTLTDEDMQFFRTFASTPKLRCVMLTNTAIGDDGLACLSGAKEIQQLNLEKTSLTDKCFDTLLTFPKLHSVLLTGTKITAAGVAKFKQARPNCRVVWDGDTPEVNSPSTTTSNSTSPSFVDPTPSAPAPGPGISAAEVFTSAKWRWSLPEQIIVAGVEDSETLTDPYLLDETGDLYFAISPERSDKADLAFSRPAAAVGTWEKPTLLSSDINSAHLEHGPRLFADGARMLFHSRRPDGLGRDDIWITRRNSVADPWEPATNLGAPVNTDQGETHAAITNDGLTLVFERQRVEGNTIFGTLMMATRPSIDAQFNEPVPLPKEINGGATNTCPAISPDGTVLLFTSNRPENPGLYIYVSTRPTTDQPFGTPFRFEPLFPTGSWKIVSCISQDSTRILMSHSKTPQEKWRLWQCRLLAAKN